MFLQTDNPTSVSRKRVDNQSLLEYANQHRHKGFFNDVNIKVAKKCFPANRMVLSCFSPVFERMFKVEMKERYEQTVEVKQVDKKSMKIIIDYMYTGRIDIDNKNVMDLLAAADYLQMDEVKEFCFEFLISILGIDTWYAVFTASKLYQDHHFQRQFYQYLMINLHKVCLTDDFKVMPKSDLMYLVGNLDRNEVKEESLCQALVTWTKFDANDRKKELFEFLRLIKFEKLSEKFCSEVVAGVDLITENDQCLKYVFEAFSRKLNDVGSYVAESTIVSFGGDESGKKCFEVFGLDKTDLRNFTDIPIPLRDLRVLKLNDVIFCIGGSSANLASRKALKIDLKSETQQWHEIAAPNVVVDESDAAIFDEVLVVAGGYESATFADPSSTVEAYWKALNQWNVIAPLQQARKKPVLVSCDGYLYAVGGYDLDGSISSVERIISWGSDWQFVEPMQTPRKNHTAVSCNGYIYVFGGENAHQKLKSVEKYDPAVNEWTYVSDMSIERRELAACVLNGRIYAIGGIDASGNFVKTIESYDPLKDSWSVVRETNHALKGNSMVVI